MKQLLSILIFFSFVSVASAQQSFTPLNIYIKGKSMEDLGVFIYTTQRCSAVYASIAKLLDESQFKEQSEKSLDDAIKFSAFSSLALSQRKNISSELAEKETIEIVLSMNKLYTTDMNENNIKTGSYFEGTYVTDDVSICTQLLSALYQQDS